MNQLMQFAHEAGLSVGYNSVGMGIIIPTKDGKLCKPEEALQAFARKIIMDDAAAMVELIEEHSELLTDALASKRSELEAAMLAGGLAALTLLKSKFQ